MMGTRMQGIYLHIPFCERKCTYCDFYSIESTGLIDTFVDRLLREITIRGRVTERPATSVFFGGGTPSLLRPDHLARIVKALHDVHTIADDAEWTMECNPGTVSLESLTAYRSLGIDRLSFGVQSFVPEELAFLHRIHSPEQADEAMFLARAAGFTNVNMDLMFALPPQTPESLELSLSRMLALKPDHISAYSLVYEHGTPLYAQLQKGLVQPHPEEEDAAMYAHAMERLTSAGYEQYEVSNFALAGHRCRHNLTYWHGDDYVSYGPSAHGYIDGERYWNHRSLTSWSEKVDADIPPNANTERLGPAERLVELAFLQLRADGLDRRVFTSTFGVDLADALRPDLGYWLDAGFVIMDEERITLTSAGYQVCDEITLKVVAALERLH